MNITHGKVILKVKLQAEAFTKSITPTRIFFTFFKLQMVLNRSKYHILKKVFRHRT